MALTHWKVAFKLRLTVWTGRWHGSSKTWRFGESNDTSSSSSQQNKALL